MTYVTNIQARGNLLSLSFNDGGQSLAYPTGSDIWYVRSDAGNASFVQKVGDQLVVNYTDGSTDIGVPTGNDGFWLVAGASSGGGGGIGTWSWPLPLSPLPHVTQEFDNGVHHTGIDLSYSGIIGASILAISNFKVLATGFTSGNGNIIKCYSTQDGSQFEFYHMLNPTTWNVGDEGLRGDTVGFADTTGTNATGAHVHMGTSSIGWSGLEAIFNRMENPRTFMANRGAPYPY